MSAILRFTIFAALCALFPQAAHAESVTLQLRWLHQFQFAGYYMAKEKGFYHAVGLDVTLLEGGPGALKPTEKVLNNQVQFAVTGSGVVIERMEGKPVVALAAIMQTSPIVWISREESRIVKPRDLASHSAYIMPAPESAELLTMLKQQGVSLGDVGLKPTTFNIDDLVEGKIDAYDGYISNEPYYLTQKGIHYNLLRPVDFGINFYGDVLVTNEDFLENNPQQVKRFVAASLKGWEYALTHIDETVHLIKEKYAPNKTLDHLYYEAREIRRLVMPDLIQIGHMNPARWDTILNAYYELGMAGQKESLDDFIYRPTYEQNHLLSLLIASASLLLLLVAGKFIWQYKSLSAQLEYSNKQLEKLATTDELTGLKNRRGFFEQGSLALSLAKRDGIRSSMLMLDIDYFKNINDNYGHAAGDAALQAFADLIRRFGRQHDLVARIGGEEFILLLIGADREHASEAATRLTEEVREMAVKVPNSDETFGFTVSIGVAEVQGSLETTLYFSDMALYWAKESGRNQIKVYGDKLEDTA